MDELDGWFTIEGSGELELEVSRCGGVVRFRIGFVGCDDGECFLDSDLYNFMISRTFVILSISVTFSIVFAIPD